MGEKKHLPHRAIVRVKPQSTFGEPGKILAHSQRSGNGASLTPSISPLLPTQNPQFPGPPRVYSISPLAM